MGPVEKVSIHGGHSGQFCNHAADTLEDVVAAYIDKGFSWVGITEHAPGISEDLLYADEREAGLTPGALLERFDAYMSECRRLQRLYAGRIDLYAGIEIETYAGCESFVPYLLNRYAPDYIVGSVHFVADINFDYSAAMYERAARAVGGIDSLYHRYFDLQHDMIESLKPQVIGHFDLIRIFDPDYKRRLRQPDLLAKIRRNLAAIRKHGLILDLNLRALAKGADEPYISASILTLARECEIPVVPGDDSHGVDSVGNYFDEGVALLRRFGFSTDWVRPAAVRAGS